MRSVSDHKGAQTQEERVLNDTNENEDDLILSSLLDGRALMAVVFATVLKVKSLSVCFVQIRTR